MMEDEGTPGGQLVLTQEQYDVFTTPEARHQIISQVPVAVGLGVPAVTDAGLFVFDDGRLTGDDIDLVLFLIDNPPIIDRLVEEAPDAP
jgi:hypothetical protein